MHRLRVLFLLLLGLAREAEPFSRGGASVPISLKRRLSPPSSSSLSPVSSLLQAESGRQPSQERSGRAKRSKRVSGVATEERGGRTGSLPQQRKQAVPKARRSDLRELALKSEAKLQVRKDDMVVQGYWPTNLDRQTGRVLTEEEKEKEQPFWDRVINGDDKKRRKPRPDPNGMNPFAPLFASVFCLFIAFQGWAFFNGLIEFMNEKNMDSLSIPEPAQKVGGVFNNVVIASLALGCFSTGGAGFFLFLLSLRLFFGIFTGEIDPNKRPEGAPAAGYFDLGASLKAWGELQRQRQASYGKSMEERRRILFGDRQKTEEDAEKDSGGQIAAARGNQVIGVQRVVFEGEKISEDQVAFPIKTPFTQWVVAGVNLCIRQVPVQRSVVEAAEERLGKFVYGGALRASEQGGNGRNDALVPLQAVSALKRRLFPRDVKEDVELSEQKRREEKALWERVPTKLDDPDWIPSSWAEVMEEVRKKPEFRRKTAVGAEELDSFIEGLGGEEGEEEEALFGEDAKTIAVSVSLPSDAQKTAGGGERMITDTQHLFTDTVATSSHASTHGLPSDDPSRLTEIDAVADTVKPVSQKAAQDPAAGTVSDVSRQRLQKKTLPRNGEKQEVQRKK
mmetsp:Transcript_23949/g.47032  ORF Transcript_23949/g.47032 Transcript_23949/m.47032 type:complete len:620 (+) Transcript_23949:183-2042(+)